MRVSTTFAALAASFSTANAYWKGLNVGANNPDGSCKSQQDWVNVFNTIKGLPGSYDSVRLFASSDCNTLANAVPASISTGIKLLVGVWATDAAHFGAEKGALESAIRAHGSDWILAISCGSEDLYRKDNSPSNLASQIYDVRGMVRALGATQEVGHVDTWTAWVDGANTEVIQACDFIGTDGYPYWQGATVQDSSNVFWQSVDAVRNVVNQVKPGAWVWITETGWPVTGDNFGSSVPSISNAAAYYKSVACAAFGGAHTFWYAYQDYTSSPSFGVLGSDGRPLYDLSC
ncbi:glycoside hydrolase family 17 protein [Aulographum hederae CBS 113979]|uniref:Probable glucan endo-1,3-beta-glucosidase eglC n=1 Tax=Aulographum hederae CBS 113979 TaxID=1176131 RepID=A0A6G1H7F0_9PEZI|nr:glycoside hydrolase family 17 protein [Aulographum hederae CBS 113979]